MRPCWLALGDTWAGSKAARPERISRELGVCAVRCARPRLTLRWCRVVETHASVPAPRPSPSYYNPLPLGIAAVSFYVSRLIRARGFQRKLSRFPLRGWLRHGRAQTSPGFLYRTEAVISHPSRLFRRCLPCNCKVSCFYLVGFFDSHVQTCALVFAASLEIPPSVWLCLQNEKGCSVSCSRLLLWLSFSFQGSFGAQNAWFPLRLLVFL